MLPATVAASRPARPLVRLATTMRAAPIRAAVATASELIEPAPTTSTVRPASAARRPGRGAAGPQPAAPRR